MIHNRYLYVYTLYNALTELISQKWRAKISYFHFLAKHIRYIKFKSEVELSAIASKNILDLFNLILLVSNAGWQGEYKGMSFGFIFTQSVSSSHSQV